MKRRSYPSWRDAAWRFSSSIRSSRGRISSGCLLLASAGRHVVAWGVLVRGQSPRAVLSDREPGGTDRAVLGHLGLTRLQDTAVAQQDRRVWPDGPNADRRAGHLGVL